MGHNTYPCIFYGWRDEYGKVLSYESIEKIYEKLELWLELGSEELSYGTKIMAVYGISCRLNEETGKVDIDEEEKEKVKRVYDVWCEKKCVIGDGLKYIKCITGDPEWTSDVEFYDFEL
jgi:hypothetical protein